jgi:hypothetical protein
MDLLHDIKQIKIEGKEYPCKMGVKASIIYQRLSGKIVTDMSTLEDVTFMFYGTMCSGGYKGTYDDFLDLIDSDFDAITNFSKAFLVEPGDKKKVNR